MVTLLTELRVSFILLKYRLGPLSVEQKKRNFTKRARQEKVDEVEKRPQEVISFFNNILILYIMICFSARY